jgi:L-cysteine/cystine lyase
MNDSLKLQQIRADLPAARRSAYLNTGSCGPLPQAVAEAMAEAAEHELQSGRADPTAYLDFQEKLYQTRTALGCLFNVDPATVALSHNTTEGMNIVTWGLEWQPRDEVITTTLEHPGALYPLYAVRARRGIVLRFADVGTGDNPVHAIERALTSRTRLLVLSHVSYSSGARFPLEEIIQVAHSQGVMVAVDGAQSAGVFDIDLTELNVDFYAISGQKWLCGPEGTGALYVRADRLADLQQTFVGMSSIERHDWQGHYLPTAGAARYHTGTVYRPGIIGFLAALRWFRETVDPVWAYSRIATMAKRCRELLQGLDSVRIITLRHRQAGLINVAPLRWSPRQMAGLTNAVIDRGYVIRAISHPPYCLRISAGFYNTDDELIGLRDTLGELLDAGPNAVEIPDLASELPDEPAWMTAEGV